MYAVLIFQRIPHLWQGIPQACFQEVLNILESLPNEEKEFYNCNQNVTETFQNRTKRQKIP